MADWIRTCQECGHKQVSKPVPEYKSESWRKPLGKVYVP